MKIVRVVFEIFTICGGGIPWTQLVGADKLELYPFRKLRKSQEQYPYQNQILHYFHLFFFPVMDINSFTNWGVVWGWQGSLSVQKNEKITGTVPILKSNST